MNDDEIKIGAAYIRVSTGKQEELSPDSQKRLILDHAKSNGIVIPQEYIFMENGISGRKADKRPQFQKMIALAKSGKFEVILLWKFSRFARNQEESIVYKSMLKKVNVDVISVSEPLVDGPFGSLIERIIEWMDEFYSIRLSGDVTRGMTEKAMRGGYQCRPPLGYMVPYHNATPVIVPEEAEIVKMIFDTYINTNMSTYQIAKKLNTMGYKTSRNKNFESRSLQYILDNPCYAGYVRWNRTENATNTIKPEDEWIVRDGKQEAIISKEIFESAQERRKKDYNPGIKRPIETYKHWLSGVLKCSACGQTLVVFRRKSRYGNNIYTHFRCNGYNKGNCPKPNGISALKIEPIVLDALKHATETGTINYNVIQPERQAINENETMLRKQLERLEQKERRIKDAYIEGIDTKEEYRENKLKIDNERKNIIDELEFYMQDDKQDIKSIMLNNVKDVYDILTSDVDADISKKNNSLKSVVDKIVFNKDEMNIDVYYYYSPAKNLVK